MSNSNLDKRLARLTRFCVSNEIDITNLDASNHLICCEFKLNDIEFAVQLKQKRLGYSEAEWIFIDGQWITKNKIYGTDEEMYQWINLEILTLDPNYNVIPFPPKWKADK